MTTSNKQQNSTTTTAVQQIRTAKELAAYLSHLRYTIFDALYLSPKKRERLNEAKQLALNITYASYAMTDDRPYTREFLQQVAIDLTEQALIFYREVHDDIQAAAMNHTA